VKLAGRDKPKLLLLHQLLQKKRQEFCCFYFSLDSHAVLIYGAVIRVFDVAPTYAVLSQHICRLIPS
jgi:hypothetical protein